eukprot:COSAG01_NODE_10722_length_2095_cov_1.356212_2_plen_204_part_00
MVIHLYQNKKKRKEKAAPGKAGQPHGTGTKVVEARRTNSALSSRSPAPAPGQAPSFSQSCPTRAESRADILARKPQVSPSSGVCPHTVCSSPRGTCQCRSLNCVAVRPSGLFSAIKSLIASRHAKPVSSYSNCGLPRSGERAVIDKTFSKVALGSHSRTFSLRAATRSEGRPQPCATATPVQARGGAQHSVIYGTQEHQQLSR